jgi:hypothetical protein
MHGQVQWQKVEPCACTHLSVWFVYWDVQFSRLWGLRGTAVDQPQDGGGDGILPTLLTLPNDATTKKGHASIKVRGRHGIWREGGREGLRKFG